MYLQQDSKEAVIIKSEKIRKTKVDLTSCSKKNSGSISKLFASKLTGYVRSHRFYY